MKKGLLAFVCVLAILASMLVVPASAQELATEGAGYQVGYAKVDINPWVNLKLADGTTIGLPDKYTDHIVTTTINDPKNLTRTISQKIVAVPLAGYGNSLERLASTMIDDNGDGYVGYGDGIYATCTIVTDQHGTTVLYVTLDCIRASSGMTSDIRNAVAAAIGGDKISPDQIMLSSSHSHSAPDFGYCSQNSVWKAYYDYVIARIATAAKDAYDTKSAAVMSKGSIEAPNGMKARGYGDGYSLNFVRHCVADGHLTIKEYRNGSMFRENDYYADTVRTAHSGGAFKQQLPNNKYTGELYQSRITLKSHVSAADETLHVLRFTRETGDPVLMVNWRAHAAMTGGGSDPKISSDYVGGLRYRLETEGYCVGFWQGASGNINGGSMIEGEAAWQKLNVNGLDNTTKYGYLLGEVTLACLDSNMRDCDMGKIRTRQARFNAELLVDSPGLTAAGNAWKADVDAGISITYPYYYVHTDGQKYIINSWYHGNSVVQRVSRTGTVEMELNVMTLGEDVAMVTVPVEAFDRYSLDATMADVSDNDWDDLIGDLYGTPFVLGYSNGHEGYLPNALAYDYNDFQPGEAYYGVYGKGSYESDTAKTARGSGEAMIAKLGEMFDVLAEECKTYACKACGKVVDWKPLKRDQLGLDLSHGHYYLAEDITADTVVAENKIGSADYAETVCLDLNGKTLDYKGRVFQLYTGSVLNILDTVDGGKVIARSGGNVQGGVIYALSNSTLNLYGGTLQFIKDASWKGKNIGRGGVISGSGAVYMYGGTIIGGELAKGSASDLPNYNGVGCAVYISGGTGRFHMFGGNIRAYSGEMAEGIVGRCVYVQKSLGVTDKDTGGGFYLSGNAVVDELYIEDHSYTSYRNVSIFGKFTGSAGFKFAPSVSLEGEVFVANTRSRGNISEANLRLVDDENYGFRIRSSRLYMNKGNYAAVSNGKSYTTLADAINAYNGGVIKLLSDVDSEVVVDKTIDVLDLNGYDIAGVTVNEGHQLTCMDSQTADFTVEDAFGYGVIGNITGNVVAVPMEGDGYLMLGDDTNGDGAADQNVSFHRVDVDLTAITLRTMTDENLCDPSIYYKSSFAGDEVVKANVKTFGVALSVLEEPNADNMGVTNDFSHFDGANFVSGKTKNNVTSTLLRNIMMEDNDETTNETNAVMPIYGRAYMQLTNGRYVFSNSHTGSMKDLVETINDRWTDFTDGDRNTVLRMYKFYQGIMSEWNVDKIKAQLATR